MPLALEPNETFEIVLESDKKKPAEQQPKFIYRYLTCRQWRQLASFNEKLDELGKNKDASTDNVMDEIFETAAIGLVGWVNMFDPQSKEPIPYDKNKLEDVVTMSEVMELIVKLVNTRPNIQDKKKLDLPSDSDTAESAKIVKDQQIAQKGD